MNYSCSFLVLACVACLSTAASAQQRPDISGLWTRGGAAETPFRPPPSGPGPVMTLRLPGQAVPRLAGDYNAPILQPWAAEVVRPHHKAAVAAVSVLRHRKAAVRWDPAGGHSPPAGLRADAVARRIRLLVRVADSAEWWGVTDSPCPRS